MHKYDKYGGGNILTRSGCVRACGREMGKGVAINQKGEIDVGDDDDDDFVGGGGCGEKEAIF